MTAPTNAEDMAFPVPETAENYFRSGLSKRELFAAMAMQGLCAGNRSYDSLEELCTQAAQVADALLAALEVKP